jgi:K+-transporting ATPase A subunit
MANMMLDEVIVGGIGSGLFGMPIRDCRRVHCGADHRPEHWRRAAVSSVLSFVGVICILGGLTFLPALSLGPITDQMMMQAGRLY